MASHITITPNPKHVRVLVGGVPVVDTTRALSLKEGQSPVVLYVPREDARMEMFTRTTRRSHCPHKGDASYYTIAAGGSEQADAAWSYETPFPAMSEIAGHLAFYTSKVSVEEA